MSKTFNIHANQRYAQHVVNLFFFNNNVYAYYKKIIYRNATLK